MAPLAAQLVTTTASASSNMPGLLGDLLLIAAAIAALWFLDTVLWRLVAKDR